MSPARIKRVIERVGEDFTVGTVSHKGVFSNAAAGTMRMWLTDFEVNSITPPFWTCVVPMDDTTSVTSVVTWNSMSLTVKKVGQARFRGQLVAKLLVFG